MTLTEQIAALVHAYRAADPLVLTTLSHRIFDESKMLGRFMSGAASMTLTRADRAIQYFSDHWPEGAVWPPGISRPARSATQRPAAPVGPPVPGGAPSGGMASTVVA